MHGQSRAALLHSARSSIKLADDAFIQWNPPPGYQFDSEKKVDREDLGVAGTRPRAHAVDEQSLRTIVSHEGYRMTLASRLGDHELYNLQADPAETTNLYHQPDQQARVTELTGRIRQWQARVSDPVRL